MPAFPTVLPIPAPKAEGKKNHTKQNFKVWLPFCIQTFLHIKDALPENISSPVHKAARRSGGHKVFLKAKQRIVTSFYCWQLTRPSSRILSVLPAYEFKFTFQFLCHTFKALQFEPNTYSWNKVKIFTPLCCFVLA